MPRPEHILILFLFLAAGHSRGQQDSLPAPTSRVATILINGNKKTKPTIILREMTLTEDARYTTEDLYARMERSQQNLMNTGLFNTVTVLPIYVSSSELLIDVTVNERWYLWPSPILQVADPNFNVWWETRDLNRLNYGLFVNQYNFRGMNETVYAKMQFGYTQQFGLRYKVPFFNKSQRWGFSVGGGYAQQKEITIGTVDDRRVLFSLPEGNIRTEWRGDMEFSLRREHDVRHFFRVGCQQADVEDTVAVLTPNYFGDGTVSTSYLFAGYTFIWDRRDLRFYPRSGHYAELKVDRMGLGLLSAEAPDITTVYGAVKKWWSAGQRWTLGASASGKATLGGLPPYFVQEGLGYRNFVRGYEYYVVDGEHFTLGKANVLFQIIRPKTYYLEPVPLEAFRTLYIAVYLNAFVDVGRSWNSQFGEANPLANEWLSGYGLGLDLVTSYDQVMRVEYALNALGEDGLFLHFSQPF